MKTETIKNFISKIVDKDYKKANEHLQTAVEEHLTARIKNVVTQKKQTELDK
jgi:hypothetical protein